MLPEKGLLRGFLPNTQLNEKQETSFLTETCPSDTTRAEIFTAETPKNSNYGFSIKMEIGRSQLRHLLLIPWGSFSVALCFQAAFNSPLRSKRIGGTRQGTGRRRAGCQKRPARLTSVTDRPAARPSCPRPRAGPAERCSPPPSQKHQGGFLSRIANKENSKKKINSLRHSFSCNLQKKIYIYSLYLHSTRVRIKFGAEMSLKPFQTEITVNSRDPDRV